MLSKSEVIDALWNAYYEVSKRQRECLEHAERCEMRGDLDGVEFWERGADEDFHQLSGILKSIRVVEDM